MGYSETIIVSTTGGGGAAATWRDPIATLADLVLLPSPALGEARYVVLEDEVYIWNGVTWEPIPTGTITGDVDGGVY